MDSPPQLIIAAKQGHPEVTAALLQRGADPNCRMNFFGRPDASNTTPLHIAAADGHTKIAVQLLEYGASIDAVTNAFSTPLCEAAKSGEESMVSLLLASGAQVDGDRRAQATPLIEAVWAHQNEVMRILLDHGADVDCRDQDGDPVLVSLAEVGNLSMIQTILSLHGEDMDCEGGSGMPAWWFAQRNGHLEVATVLRDWYQQRTTQPGRSFPADLRDDSNLSLAELGEEKFVRDVEIAQDAIYPVGGSSDWKKLVRFMVEVEDPEYQVEVIEPYKQDESDDQPFVAVSYIWASQEADSMDPLQVKVPNKSSTGFTIRPTRASPDLIRRSFAFARSRGIERIWIDQECIHQDDPEDKRALLGVMHLLYRHADVTLGVLGRKIQCRKDVDAIKSLMNWGPGIDDLCYRIFQDRWFHRAWTSQESINAGPSNMVYLVGWARGFDPTGEQWEDMASVFEGQKIQHELELGGHHLGSMSFHGGNQPARMTEYLLTLNHGKEGFTLSSGKLDEMSWWIDNQITEPPISTLPDLNRLNLHRQELKWNPRADHHAMSIINAYMTLNSRANLFRGDRLSIYANLARYEYHLDMEKITGQNPDISSSACLMTLALSNGDQTLLLDSTFSQDEEPGRVISQERPSWLPHGDATLSFVLAPPIMPGFTLSGEYVSTGFRSFVVSGKLFMQGLLWDIRPFRGLVPLQGSVRKLISLVYDENVNSNQATFEAFALVVHQLFKCGPLGLSLLEIILTAGAPSSLKSPSSLSQLIEELKSCYRNGSRWPTHFPPFDGRTEDSLEGWQDAPLLPPSSRPDYISGDRPR